MPEGKEWGDEEDEKAEVNMKSKAYSAEALADRMKKFAIESKEQLQERLRVIQSDPNSHLTSAKTFAELNLPEYLLNGVYDMNFTKPSKIQELALPLIVAQPPKNLIGQAQSGSGKTAAFVLGMLYRIDLTKKVPQAVCLTPTRELANQIVSECIVPMSKHMEGLEVVCAVAGERFARGALRAQIVVGTPGKIKGLLTSRSLPTKDVKVFVLDEADDMVAVDSHRDNSMFIFRAMPRDVQCLLFSATFSPEILSFAKSIVKHPNIIKIASDEELVLDVIRQLWIDTRKVLGGKLQCLIDIYQLLEIGQSIIFVATKATADSVAEKLTQEGYTISVLHGGMEGAERDLCMKEFRDGLRKVLITTNVLARGVDVPAVSLVVNYDLPVGVNGYSAEIETYLHRIGRTGRFGREGCAINFVNSDEDKEILRQIEAHLSSDRELIREAPDDIEELITMLNGEG